MLYAFEIVNRETGETVAHFELPLPMAQRDSIEVRRAPFPNNVALVGMAPNPAANETLRCLYRAEQRLGSTSDFHRRIGHSPETYKQVWADNS